MTCDILLKSYPADYQWLAYALRSIQRFATGFRNVIVVVPFGAEGPPTGTMEKVFRLKEEGEPYLFQQIVKMNADAFSDAEFICETDSDVIFTRPVTPHDLIADNRKPVWYHTPYTSIDSGDGQTWKIPTEKVMQQPVTEETMRRFPFTIPRWALIEFRQWMWRTHGMSLERYILSQPNRHFSEFNALGNYLWFHHHDKIEWRNTDNDMGVPFVHQSWSYGGINSDTRTNLERALA